MSEPDLDTDNPDTESMFDFLDEGDKTRLRRRPAKPAPAERALPIIRKPVPVSESGPLLPPGRGAPVEPPPQLTGQTNDDQPLRSSGQADVSQDEFGLDFLDDISSEDDHVAEQARQQRQPRQHGNVTRIDPRSRRQPEQVKTRVEARPAEPTVRSRTRVLDHDLDAFDAPDADSGPLRRRDLALDEDLSLDDGLYLDDGLDLDDGLGLDESWHSQRDHRAHVALEEERDHDSRGRRRRLIALLVGVLLIAAGAASFLAEDIPDWLSGLTSGVSRLQTDSSNPISESDPLSVETVAPASDTPASSSPLMQRFRAELERLESLVASGALDEAEEALGSMDRTVYGYGAAEFAALENRIGELRAGGGVADNGAQEAARLAEEQAAREEAARLAEEQAAREEAARLAEEQATREEAARLAEEQAAREEAARLAEEQAARAEAARLAEEQAAREEAARLAEEQAAREEAVRLAEEQTARIEQLRLAEQAARDEAARLESSRSQDDQTVAAVPSTPSANDADRLATDRRIAEERAALQRQQAQAQRLEEAQQREEQSAESASIAGTANGGAINSASPDSEPEASIPPISDADLQLVYRRFVDLQQAISDRDINTVVSLTERSGVRIQQFMQLFENSSAVDARIKNVSTSNATGEIKGVLQINRVQRANGSFVQPPAALASISLSSRRDANGWSAIDW